MIDKITITSIGMPKDMFKTRDVMGQKLTKPVLQAAVAVWHEKMLPEHFKAHAANRYHYRSRKASTKKKKARAAARGNSEARLPLVYSGRLKREVTRMVRVTGTAKKATANMSGPRYVHMYSKGGDRPFLAGELTATTAAERDELVKFVDAEMTRRMNEDDSKTVTRVG